jgi:hypothetical protein
MGQPFLGAAYDFYWYLPALLQREPVLVEEPPTAQDRPIKIGPLFGSGDWTVEYRFHAGWFRLPAPRLPPPLPLVWGLLFQEAFPPSVRIRSGAFEFPGGYCYENWVAVVCLSHPDDRVRLDEVKTLGSVHALIVTLESDPSAAVREAAAKALSRIKGIGVLSALKIAAQKDCDRDVRRAAEFAVEMIESASPTQAISQSPAGGQIFSCGWMGFFN